MKPFSKYDVIGVMTPGALLLLLLGLHTIKSFKEISDLSIGGLGLLSILCFVIGHIVQSIGNLIEWFYFRFFGKPTIQLLRKRFGGLASNQIVALEKQIATRYGFRNFKVEKQTKKTWPPIIRQIISDVSTQPNAERLESFNSNYGLFRGLLAAVLIAIPVQITMNGLHIPLLVADFAIGALLFARMHRFAKHYAYELITQFLLLRKTNTREVKHGTK